MPNIQFEAHFYFAPGRGAKYCDERVCMSVCSLAYIKKTNV